MPKLHTAQLSGCRDRPLSRSRAGEAVGSLVGEAVAGFPRPKSPLAFPKRAPSPSQRRATPIFGLSTAAAGSAEMMYLRRYVPHQKLRTTKYEGLDQHPSEHCENNLIMHHHSTRIVTNLNSPCSIEPSACEDHYCRRWRSKARSVTDDCGAKGTGDEHERSCSRMRRPPLSNSYERLLQPTTVSQDADRIHGLGLPPRLIADRSDSTDFKPSWRAAAGRFRTG